MLYQNIDLITLQMIFKYLAKKLISYDESKASRKLRENYKAFMDGLVSFPLNIPGTAYHACLQVLNSHYMHMYKLFLYKN